MGIGLEMQIGLKRETTYDTRVVPDHFFLVNSESIDYSREKYRSQGLGGGPWLVNEITTTQRGTGTLPMEVPTVGFGAFLDLLHPNAVTPTAVGATDAFEQVHTLSGAPTKSATIQVGVPTLASTPQPFDYTGSMLSGIEFAWEPASVLMATPSWVIRSELTDQTLATPDVPVFDLFSFKKGSLSIGGTPVANITGGGNMSIQWALRDDAYALGTDGKIAKPIGNDRASAGGQFTADFGGMTEYNRVVNDTKADVVLLFVGPTAIDGAEFPEIEVTIPDCSFNQSAPAVAGPGVVSQTVSFSNASATADPPVIRYQSSEDAI